MWAVLQISAMEIPASASYRRCRISLSVCWECRIGLMLSCVIGRSFSFGLPVRSSGAAGSEFTFSQERIRCDCMTLRIFFLLVEPNSFHGHARTAARIGGAVCHLRCVFG